MFKKIKFSFSIKHSCYSKIRKKQRQFIENANLGGEKFSFHALCVKVNFDFETWIKVTV